MNRYQGHSAAGRFTSMKNSSNNIGNRTPDLRHRIPQGYDSEGKIYRILSPESRVFVLMLQDLEAESKKYQNVEQSALILGMATK